jgi:hypothetical protein
LIGTSDRTKTFVSHAGYTPHKHLSRHAARLPVTLPLNLDALKELV